MSGYRVLCHNCNFAVHWGNGICAHHKKFPHQKDALQLAAFDHYTRGERVCSCCGENNASFLTIDHVDGGGSVHLQSIGMDIYSWLKRNLYPDGFAVLCHNCNHAKGSYGKCPHQTGKGCA